MFDKLKKVLTQSMNKQTNQAAPTPEEEGPDSIQGYEIFDPGSSFNEQTAFIQKEKKEQKPKKTEVPENVQQVVINPQDVQSSVGATKASLSAQQQGASPNANMAALANNQQLQGGAAQPGVGAQPGANGAGGIDPNAAGTEEGLPDDALNPVDPNQRIRKPLKRYRYIIVNSIGKKENGTFDAETENDVRNFLISQDYQVLEVKERSKWDIDVGGNGKMKASELSFSLTQLSTYIKSGIPLSDSVKILAKQTKKASLKKSFNQLVYELLKGETFSSALEMQDTVYPKLLVNMVKTAEMTGDLPSILDDMAEYYTSMDQTRKQMKSAMTYPIVVLTIAIGVLIFMLTYLVPQFTQMFEDQGAELPALTKAIVNISTFIREKWYVIIIVIAIAVFAFIYTYRKVQKFRETVQTILMHTPVIGNIIIYNETANFTKTFASLINHGVFITDSMEILSKITTNEIFKRIISKTLENLAKGDTISTAFRGEWAIPIVAYEMIVTGESTGQLGTMMEKVADHFQMLHKTVIDQMKSLVEPFMICFLAVIVGVILVSIIQPMFSIYSQIK